MLGYTNIRSCWLWTDNLVSRRQVTPDSRLPDHKFKKTLKLFQPRGFQISYTKRLLPNGRKTSFLSLITVKIKTTKPGKIYEDFVAEYIHILVLCITLYYITLQYNLLYYIILYYIILYYIILYYIILYYIILYYII